MCEMSDQAYASCLLRLCRGPAWRLSLWVVSFECHCSLESWLGIEGMGCWWSCHGAFVWPCAMLGVAVWAPRSRAVARVGTCVVVGFSRGHLGGAALACLDQSSGAAWWTAGEGAAHAP
eukprot:scaffold155373_cov30-Tisochrysis_lutea.AAC.4